MEDSPKDDAELCMSNALTFLEYRPRSEAEMRQYLLKKNWSEETVDQVVSRLLEIKYLDDATFARDYVASRSRNRPIGPARMMRDLRRKQVPSEVAAAALDELPEDYQEEAALRAATRLWEKNLTTPEPLRVRRVVSHLVRRGFSFSAAQSAVRSLSEATEEIEFSEPI